ncbi:uncharacterized protein HMPREF1541_01422 [Cyphellophora europaea CBS 101466]|uniref:Heterokaryon incompatibility domain-containing protein n=1 Tax=Cyphellophora europaea (strain CBS 101466) TaxID=1220924 RepID=W2SF18_CYPE1|nr:uncharacterized protein HMPREF1541_01422 [Cyphellophora europaea CBS 101466]ETN47230.1 hypothetical protein HMPREF1541_01422 [Cyphellophora europaea CBS 101466]
MYHLFLITSSISGLNEKSDVLDLVSDIDIEEILDTNLPGHVRDFLIVVRGVFWNRRTFQSSLHNTSTTPLVGLAPHHARIGDQICILYGCSVPVVLRALPDSGNDTHRQLIGDAYVYGAMDGEMVESSLGEDACFTPVEFIIR